MIDNDFDHFILTRFNLPTPGRESIIRADPGWIGRRFELFERFCAPSVAMQTKSDFRWLVFFDEATPQPHRRRAIELGEQYRYTPVFTRLFGPSGWIEAVRGAAHEPSPWLLTTRLDNDDAIATDFIQRLHSALSFEERSAYNFPSGLVLQDRYLYRLKHPSNPFVSYFERFDQSATTIMFAQHEKVASLASSCLQLPGPPAWLQIIHGENVSNRRRGQLTSVTMDLSRFPNEVIERAAEPSALSMLVHNLGVGPVMAARDRLAAIIRRMLER